MKVYLDNQLVIYPEDNVRKPSFTLRRKDEEGFKAFSLTGDLTFYGDSRDYLYQRLVAHETALENEVELKIVDDCCPNINPYLFNIKPETLEWCENSCKMTAAAIEKSTMEQQLRCLRNTVISDNWNGFKQKQHPRFTYCNEIRPQWHHDIVLINGILLGLTSFTWWPIVISLIPVIKTIAIVVTFLHNTFGVNFNDEFYALAEKYKDEKVNDIIAEYKNWINNLMDFMVGCGKKHPSPLVRDYAINVCGKCGLGFESSIFNNPASAYYNTCYHFAPVHKGVPLTGDSHGVSSTDYWIEANQPILNGIMFFDQLKGMMNADWAIRDGKVFFERRDFAFNSTPWLDLTALEKNDYEICYSWSKKPRYAYGVFEYQTDAINSIGGEAKRRWGDIIEWNSPPRPGQKGEFHPAIEFASCRFRDDGIDRDVLSAYRGAPFGIGERIQKWDHVILLNQHLSNTPMLLIWDAQNSSVDDARVSDMDFAPNNWENNSEAGLNQYYNYPFWFDEFLENNMYTNFWYIENPRYSGFKGKAFEATVAMSCSLMQAMNGASGLDGCIKTKEGISKTIDEIEVNYAAKTITIKGQL
jgi:hypothetical protein